MIVSYIGQANIYFFIWVYTCEKTGEDKDLSIVSNVELRKLFPGKKVRNTLNSDLDGTLVMCVYIYIYIVCWHCLNPD